MADRTDRKRYPDVPRKTPLEERSQTVLGLIALAVLTALVATVLVIRAVGPGYHRVTADFLQAAALQPKNPVTVAGVHVGTVTGMELMGDKVRVTMNVSNDVKLGKDSKAVIMVMTILGSRYLSLEPVAGGSLPDNHIDLAHTKVPYDLQEALQDATYNWEQVNTDELAKTVEVLGKQLADLPPLIPRAMNNLQTLSTLMADRRSQFGDMLKTMQAVTTTLRRQQASIGRMIIQGNELFGEFLARQAAFTAMLQSVTGLVNTLNPVIVNDRAKLDELLQNMRQLTDLAAKHDDLLRNILQVAPVTVRNLANATGTGNAAELNIANGLVVDSWMCAISGRAQQFGMIQYFKDCK